MVCEKWDEKWGQSPKPNKSKCARRHECFEFTFCNCFSPSSVLTHACSTLKSILSRTVPWRGRNGKCSRIMILKYSNERKRCFVRSMVQYSQTFGLFEHELSVRQHAFNLKFNETPYWQPRPFLRVVLCCVLAHHDCFKYLFHHHSSQVPENFIQIWDWLHYLSDLPFSLFDHNCVLLHQHELIICETLKQKDKSQINTSFIGFDVNKVYIGDFLIRISNSQNLVIYGQIFILFH